MSSLTNLLSGLLKDTVKSVAATVKDKVEDVIDEALHPEDNTNITIESLYNRLGEVQSPMTGEEFLEHMNSIGCDAKQLSAPNNMKMPDSIADRKKTYLASKDNLAFSATFTVYKEEEEAVQFFNSLVQTYKTETTRVFLSEEDGRIFQHNTVSTEQLVFKSYLLLSRIENTILMVTIQEENADAYATELVNALQGTGY